MEKRITAGEIIIFIGLLIYLIIIPTWSFSRQAVNNIWKKIKTWFGIVKKLTPEDILQSPEEQHTNPINKDISVTEYQAHGSQEENTKQITEVEETLNPKILEKIHSLQEQAIVAKEKGDLDEAEKLFIEARGLYDGKEQDLSIDKMLAEIYFDQGQYVKASSLLKKIISEDESQHKATWQMGYIYVIQGDFDTAKLFLEKAISLKDDNPKYYIALVDIFYQQELWDDAIQLMEKVQKLRPTNLEYLISLGQLNEKTNNISKAEYRYTKVIELDPHHTIAKQKLS